MASTKEKLTFIFIVNAVLIGVQCQSNGTRLPPPEQDGFVCEQITEIPLCSNVGYGNATFPNFRDHMNQLEANSELNNFLPLIESSCSNALVTFLCSIYAPFCDIKFPDFRLFPCKNLCEYVRQGCEHLLLQYNIEWPQHLNCNHFPSRQENGSCFGPEDPSTIQSPTTSTPTGTSPPPDSPPGPPHCFEITVRCPKVLSYAWFPPASEGLTDPRINYLLSCNPQPDGFPRQFANQSLAEHIQITVQELQPNTSYICNVSASNAAGSGPVATAVATTLVPLNIQFAENSPSVEGGTVHVEFQLNRPANEIQCQLLPILSRKQDCSNGSISFRGIPPGSYTVRVVAPNNECDRVVRRKKIKVLNIPTECAVNITGVDISGGIVTVNFNGTGPVNAFSCSIDLDRRTSSRCQSPWELSELEEGEHQLKIVPLGRQCTQRTPYTTRVTLT